MQVKSSLITRGYPATGAVTSIPEELGHRRLIQALQPAMISIERGGAVIAASMPSGVEPARTGRNPRAAYVKLKPRIERATSDGPGSSAPSDPDRRGGADALVASDCRCRTVAAAPR